MTKEAIKGLNNDDLANLVRTANCETARRLRDGELTDLQVGKVARSVGRVKKVKSVRTRERKAKTPQEIQHVLPIAPMSIRPKVERRLVVPSPTPIKETRVTDASHVTPTKGPKNRQGDIVTPTAFRISADTMATLRGAAFLLGRTIASLVEDALREHLEKLERVHGKFPKGPAK